MDASGLKRKDTTKGPPLRILSLDGGGVRGYSMFLLLQELMHRTFVEIEGRAPRRAEIPKPCEHFDLIVGTGTGGLIAIMLGRLRLDLETCKELYVRLTRMVFRTDKTIVGIPYRHTLFKATRLEDAIKEAVMEHTVDDCEGNDTTDKTSPPSPLSPLRSPPRPSTSDNSGVRRHQSNASVLSFSARSPGLQFARPITAGARGCYRGNPDALLYDEREKRTKTAVTAVYKGTPAGGEPAMLRSYDSRREPAPEFDCTIWQAGRATCSIGLAFKPIQIGQSVFHDDGAGFFNPSITALDEAAVNEWPGREVGVFISLGTGKRPKGSDADNVLWYEGFMGEFAEARRKLIAKIEGCEKIHELMKREHLSRRGVNIENYYRLNDEVGVGEFGMNEYDRLAEISTRTRRYLSLDEEQRMVQSASAKLAKIHLAKLRWERSAAALPQPPNPWSGYGSTEIPSPLAVELPGDMPIISTVLTSPPPSRQSYDSAQESLQIPPAQPSPLTPSPRSSFEPSPPQPVSENEQGSQRPHKRVPVPSSARVVHVSGGGATGQATSSREDAAGDQLTVTSPTPEQYRTAAGTDKIAVGRPADIPRRPGEPTSSPAAPPLPQLPPRQQQQQQQPPPIPPKTPIPENQARRAGRTPFGPVGVAPPYPVDDVDEAPPPAVNMARKPNNYRRR